MKVLYISKASIVAAYQDKLRALATHVQLEALIPKRWGKLCATMSPAGAAFRMTTDAALLHGHNHLHVYLHAQRCLIRAAPDLVHLDEEPYSAVTFQFARLCRRARVPFLFFAWQNLIKPLPAPFDSIRRYVFQHAAAGIAGTDRAADVLRTAGFRGPLFVIPQLGVDVERFRPDPAAGASIRARLGIPPAALVFGYAGRLVREKGVDLLIRAAAAVPDAHVVVIGTGPERTRLERHAIRAGVAARTHFTGHVESLDMPHWLNALHALVLPSLTTRTWSEQFGRVLVEAMACGVPVVAARSGEIPTVVGDAGLLFGEADTHALVAHLRALSAAPLRARLADAGRVRVCARFTQQHIARATAEVYEQIASGHLRTRRSHAVVA